MAGEYKLILKNRKFIYIWSSQILSQLTINIMNFVFLIKLFEQTGSAIATSLLWVSYSLPALLIGPIASAYADIVDKRKILMYTNLLQALTILLFAVSGKTNFFVMYGVVFVYSLLNQFYVPAETATLPSVLNKKVFTQGNSLFFMTMQASLVVGYGIAGTLNHFLGFERTLFLCSFFLFIAFLTVSFLPRLKSRHKIPMDLETGFKNFFKRILEGYEFIKGEKKVLAPFILSMSFQVALAIVIVSIPVIAVQIAKISLNSSGVFLIVPAAIGALTGAFFLPKLIAKGWRKKRIIENSLKVITVVIGIMVFIIPELTYWYRIGLIFISILFAGAAFVGVIIPSQTYLQELTPHDLMGRVFGNFWFLTTAVSVVPVIFSGTITEFFGIRFFMFLMGALSFSVLMFSKKHADSWLKQ
ncbi:MAG: MFS transporter [bacterium]|nr:MFS transporter [bacterium]